MVAGYVGARRDISKAIKGVLSRSSRALFDRVQRMRSHRARGGKRGRPSERFLLAPS